MSRWFGRGKEPSSIALPLTNPTRPVYVVYFAPVTDPPSAEALAQAVASWSDDNLKPPLRDAATTYRQGLLSIDLVKADRLPPLPLPLLQYLGMGELDERILRSATEVVVLSGPDLNAQPYTGLWSTLAAALGVRDLLQGTIFDPQALRIIDLEKAPGWFAADGRVSVADHIQVPFSIQDSGLGWMTTRGLEKFGVPELELRDIPPNLQKLGYLMNAVAQLLVEESSRQVAKDPKAAMQLTLPAEITVDMALLGRALGEPLEDPAAALNPQQVGLRFDPQMGPDHPPFIQLVKPGNFKGDTGMWLNDALGHLMKPVTDLRFVRTSGDAMTLAHERAVGELPAIKHRFLDGLKPGEVLYLKHGFPTSAGDKEYIWVVVNRWEGERITAQVGNDPRDVPGVVMGQTVVIGEADVFDWTLMLPDGRQEGGYTTQVVLAEGKQSASE